MRRINYIIAKKTFFLFVYISNKPKNPIFNIPRRECSDTLIHADRCITRYLDEGAHTSYVEMALRDTFSLIGDSTFRPNSALIDFQFPGDMYAHAHVFTQPGLIRGRPPSPSTFSTHPFVSRWLFYSGNSPANLLESNACGNCGSMDSAFFLFFFFNGRGGRNKEQIADDKPQRQRFFCAK